MIRIQRPKEVPFFRPRGALKKSARPYDPGYENPDHMTRVIRSAPIKE